MNDQAMKKIMLLMVPLFLLLFSCSEDDAVMPQGDEEMSRM
jgi:hypothetical protein